MKDAARSLLEAAGHTLIGDLLAVKGAVSIVDAEGAAVPRRPVWLAATERGLSLVVTDDEGAVVDRTGVPVSYISKMIEDQLSIGHEKFGIPTGKGDVATRVLALSRLLPAAQRDRKVGRRRHVLPRDEVDQAAIVALLDPDEVLLAWLPTSTDRKMTCAIQGEVEVELVFALSDRRCALVGVSPAGEVLTLPLPRRAIVVKHQVGRDEVRAGDLVFHAHLSNEDRFHEVASIPALDAAARIREVARIDLESRGTSLDTAKECGALLGVLIEDHDPTAVLVASCLSLPATRRIGTDERNRAAATLIALHPDGEDIGAIYDAWHLNLDEGVSLLEGLLAEDTLRAAAVPLHRKIHRDLSRGTEGFGRAAIDIAFAEHLVESGAFVEAENLLRARLIELPSEELADLLPPHEADLTAGAGGQEFRIRLLELQALAKGRGKPDLDTVAELARLQPLVASRIEALNALAGGELKRAARQVLGCLAPGGLSSLDPDVPNAPDPEVHQLLDESVFDQLRHPASRAGDVMDRLQAFIADVKVPNHNALKKFCERLTEGDDRHEAALAALSDAAFAFGMRSVDGFVSRGDHSLGIRAYEGSPPFVLIGGDHLDASSAYALHPWELRFAIAAEVAHLRFGHTRVTSSEVWDGAWKKGKASVSFVVGFLPILKGWSIADRLVDLIGRATKSPVGRVIKGVDVTGRAMKEVGLSKGTSAGEIIGGRGDDLIAAHRAMQLTADRAGLLFCDDIGAAIRSVFLEDPETRAELPLAEKHGLARVLGRRDESGEILYQGLAIRVCAMVSFYLSEEYRSLRRALALGEVKENLAVD